MRALLTDAQKENELDHRIGKRRTAANSKACQPSGVSEMVGPEPSALGDRFSPTRLVDWIGQDQASCESLRCRTIMARRPMSFATRETDRISHRDPVRAG
jgi:hypothetical protein